MGQYGLARTGLSRPNFAPVDIMKVMTQLEVLFRYATPPTEQVAMALARTRDVYGIRRLEMDPAERTVRVEFDATRLNAATVGKLLQSAGLDLAEELSLIPPPPPEPEPAPAV